MMGKGTAANRPDLRVEQVKTSELAPYAGNAKEHPSWQVGEICNSIKEFGFSDPVGAWHAPDGHAEIVEGHGRVLAARELGMETVPVVWLDHLDDAGRRAYALAHNQLTMNTGWDTETLDAELAALADLDIDMGDFGFEDMGAGDADWFSSGDKGEPTEGDDEEYRDFVSKFEQKHTTDDCYTPPKVYEAVAGWVSERYGIDRSHFVRPFYPGGDYKNERYPEGCVVVDNPPFSILAEILAFYADAGVDFFLFAPTLTLFSSSSSSNAVSIPVGANVTYENGASVNTSFLTSFGAGEWRVASSPSLYEAVQGAADEVRAEASAEMPKYSYPDEVITSAMVARYSRYGVDFRVPVAESAPCSALDAQRERGKAIFGKGYLLSERAAAERAAAERAAATRWDLSDRERGIVASLGGKAASAE